MRTRSIPHVLIVAAVVLLAAVVWASYHTPSNMNVQGRLTDDTGAPVPAGFKQFTFKIFDAPTGGTEIWPAGAGEEQAVATDDNGLWDATVGAVIPLTDDVFADTARWLEIRIDDGVNPPETLSRVKISTSPFVWQASRSEYADSSTTVADLAIHNGKLDNDAVTTDKIASGAVELSDLNQNGAADGQVMKWNGSQWVVGYEMPAGVIVMWSGTAATIPPGWALCDGANGTPDLRNRFVMGATDAGGTGGSTTASWGNHTHTVDPPNTGTTSNSSSYCLVWEVGGQCVAANGHTHSVNIAPFASASDGANSVSIIPPYYNLAYIMKL